MAPRGRSTCGYSSRPGSRKAPRSKVPRCCELLARCAQADRPRWPSERRRLALSSRASASRKAASQVAPRPRTRKRGPSQSSPTRQRACLHWSAIETAPRRPQRLKLADLALLIGVMGLTLLPAARHRLVERGEDTFALLRFTLNVVGLALLPFAVALGLDLYHAGWTRGPAVAVALGVATFAVAAGLWYGIALVFGHRSPPEEEGGEMKLEDKIVQVLTEARVVLPGAQALLGFQLAMTLMQGYESLPESSKDMHLAATCAIALTVIFLMAPPAY